MQAGWSGNLRAIKKENLSIRFVANFEFCVMQISFYVMKNDKRSFYLFFFTMYKMNKICKISGY
jgi:hypothetical protein